MVNVVIPSKLLFSFFFRGNIRKQRLRAFIKRNGWSGWRSHTFLWTSWFFFSFLFQNAANLWLFNFDQHCSKGSKFSCKKFVFQKVVWVCVYIYIYILKYNFFFFRIFFPSTTILFECEKLFQLKFMEVKPLNWVPDLIN